jgi:hypothetical protein
VRVGSLPRMSAAASFGSVGTCGTRTGRAPTTAAGCADLVWQCSRRAWGKMHGWEKIGQSETK